MFLSGLTVNKDMRLEIRVIIVLLLTKPVATKIFKEPSNLRMKKKTIRHGKNNCKNASFSDVQVNQTLTTPRVQAKVRSGLVNEFLYLT